MQTVLITIHLMIVVALIAVVLLQKSEGGALGIGGGSGGNFMSGRAAANALSRATAILATLFFATSIALTILATTNRKPQSVIDKVIAPTSNTPAVPVPGLPANSDKGLLPLLKQQAPAQNQAPQTVAPEAPASQAPASQMPTAPTPAPQGSVTPPNSVVSPAPDAAGAAQTSPLSTPNVPQVPAVPQPQVPLSR